MASDRVACHGIGGEYYGGIVDADDIKLAGIEYGSSEAAKGVCEGKLDKALQILRTRPLHNSVIIV